MFGSFALFGFLMMMWLEYINKTWLNARFCLHCYIPRTVCKHRYEHQQDVQMQRN